MSDFAKRIEKMSPSRLALLALELRSNLDAAEAALSEPIAIVGLDGRFPSAPDPDSFWTLLREGRDAVTEVPSSRWNAAELFDPDPDRPGTVASKWGGFLEGVDAFDAALFGLSRAEAASMDPQQRILLEVAWRALESGGYSPRSLGGSRTGVFVGITGSDFANLLLARGLGEIETHFGSGTSHSVAAGRISYSFGFHGPSMAVDTACSSSLVAVHLAAQSLRARECDLALAGGVNLTLSPVGAVVLSRAHMMSPDGKCKAFDADANGFVRGEGCALIVLKRLSDALRAGDRVRAVIRGSAVNQDGRSAGITAPNGQAQEAVIRAALSSSRVESGSLSYVEAHGTGTVLGDPIEAHALAAVFGTGRSKRSPLVIGSVKTNLGHLEAAAGIAGLVKTVLALENGWIPANLHFRRLNPHIDLGESAIEVAANGRAWPRASEPRRAGVSSFGFSGTNVHLILEEAPLSVVRSPSAERPVHVLCISSRTEAGLEAMASEYEAYLSGPRVEEIGDICYTANVGRAHLAHRVAVTGSNASELGEAIRNGRVARGESRGGVELAFLFTGQGAQYAQMGRVLYESSGVFQAAVDRCAKALEPHLEVPIMRVLFGDVEDAIDETRHAQPAIFAIQLGLSELWRSWGVRPSAVLGHSVGEIAASVVAGGLTLESASRLVAARGRLMHTLPPGGAMISVAASEERARDAADAEGVDIAAVNGPRRIVLSGECEAVRRAARRLDETGSSTVPLRVSHAFHSRLMASIEGALEVEAGNLEGGELKVEVISGWTGRAVAKSELQSGNYWRRQLREPVRFGDGITRLHALGFRAFLEIGPGATLLMLAREALDGLAGRNGKGEPTTFVPSLLRGASDWSQLLVSLAQLHVFGAEVDFSAFDAPFHRRRVLVPGYSFERQVFPRPEVLGSPGARRATHPLLGRGAGDGVSTRFEVRVGFDVAPYLRDHRFKGSAILPMGAHAELAASAISEVFGSERALADFVVRSVLGVEHESRPLRVEVERESVRIAAQVGQSWVIHAAGRVVAAREPPGASSLRELRARITDPVDVESSYARLEEFSYGPSFRRLMTVWRGRGEALGRASLGAGLSAAGYSLHPTLIDAGIQVLGACVAPASREYIPTGIGRLEVREKLATDVWIHAVLGRGDAGDAVLSGSIHFAGPDGQTVGFADNVTLRRIDSSEPEAFAGARMDSWLQVQAFERRPPRAPTSNASRTFSIMADRGGFGRRLGSRLQALGHGVRVSLPGEEEWPVQLAAEVTDLVYLGALDFAEPSEEDEVAAAEAVVGRALSAVSTLLSRRARPRVWFVTQGAQAVGLGRVRATQATLLGLMRTVSAEHPELRSVGVDLDVRRADVEALVSELVAPSPDAELVFRGGERFARARAHPPEREGHARLVPSRTRLLRDLRLEPIAGRDPGPGEVEVRAEVVGLNFRDVLGALGMIDGAAPLGGEVAGRVLRVGEGVPFSAGDRVMGMAPNPFGAVTLTAADRLVRIRDGLSTEAAATLPVAFMTASHALLDVARLSAGESVLIHAAAGGVGLAALDIARRVGARIFATAGSEEKRGYLRSLGVELVSGSRTPEFEVAILAATGGRGVDVVLNSLSGEMTAASFRSIARRGRFLELGKLGVWSAERVAALGKDLEYALIDLSTAESGMLKTLLERVEREERLGQLTALPRTVFGSGEIPEAFEHMAEARHTGKVVVRRAPGFGGVSATGTHLVTGGLGGLGLRVAEWLVAKGAKSLVLVSRRGPNPSAAEIVRRLAREARVEVMAVDVASRGEVQSLLEHIRSTLAPLAGIVHAAGTLDDGVLERQSWDRFRRVFLPKVQGARNLDLLTAEEKLDYFVLFSSIGALNGAPGQGGYSAANAFLDALAHDRRARGLAGTSIDWGPWTGAGMAGERVGSERWRASGVSGIDPADGVRALERALELDVPQVSVDPAAAGRDFESRLAAPSGVRQHGDLERGSESSGPLWARPADQLERELRLVWAELLGSGDVGVADNFFEIGGHSLLAVTLVAEIEKRTGKRLPLDAVYQTPTIAGLARILRSSDGTTPWRGLVPIRVEGSEPPLFAVSGVGGRIAWARNLSAHLSADQPVYAFEGESTEAAPATHTLELIARTNLDRLRVIQPQGPYAIVGVSAGGLLAFEMALQLSGAGERVEFLGLLDSRGPKIPAYDTVQSLARRRARELSELSPKDAFEELKRAPRQVLGAAIDGLRARPEDARNHIVELLLGRRGSRVPLAGAFARYRPGRAYTGSVVLFRAKRQKYPFTKHVLLGWEGLASHVEVRVVPGNHSNMYREPRVQVLARELGRALAEGRGR
ncbi:MAG: SDR family NAD(P)-dependent oxidoreductase [Deltaproteobacteria bacterium]|nr:SDR family NAD(P)-dependent oxidoreductase [Deltaproteobacteria bacterium]